MEEFSSKPMSLNEVTAVVESKAMWEHYANVTQRMRRGEQVSKKMARSASWQWHPSSSSLGGSGQGVAVARGSGKLHDGRIWEKEAGGRQ